MTSLGNLSLWFLVVVVACSTSAQIASAGVSASGFPSYACVYSATMIQSSAERG